MNKHAFKLTAISVSAALWAASAVAQQTAPEASPLPEAPQGSTQADESVSNATAETATQDAPAAAPAAEAAAPRTPMIEEIVVTARKREESIQSVPLAITAVSGEMLEQASVTDVNGLATQVPSLVVVPGSSGSRSIPTFAIRGQSQQELSILADPSVPVYFNDVVIERQQGVNSALFDIQSVEVLKGPQGTLFGRNSTGGAINIKANRPSKEFEGYVGGTVGNRGRMNTTAMINQPLTDWAQLRVAGQTTDSDGWVKDVLINKDVNYEHTKAGRLSLALQPIDGLDSVFTYSRFIEDDGGSGAVVQKLGPNSVARNNAGLGYVGQYAGQAMLDRQQQLGNFKIESGVEQYTRISTWDLANTTTYEINDNLSVKNIIGKRKVTGSNYDDNDGMPIPFFQIARSYDFDQFSEELQLLGSTDTLNWVVGAYYFNEKGGTDDYSITTKSVLTGPGSQIPQPHPSRFPGWSLTDPDGENTSKSVFAQGTQKLDSLLDGLALTVGARYTWDTRAVTVRNRSGNTTDPDGQQVCRFSRDLDGDPTTPEIPAGSVPIDQCVASFEKKFSEPTYNVSLDYQFTRSNLVYLAHRRGYRTGGFGARAGTEAALSRTYNAETVTDFELGTKNDFTIGNVPMRINLALFYADYKDIQRLLTDPATLPIQTVPVNAGKATIKGGELEFTVLATENLEFSGFWSYTDAGYDEFLDPSGDNPATPEIEYTDRSGQPFARAPKNIYSLTTRYSLPVSSTLGRITAMANYYHTDGYSTNDSYAPEQSVDGYGLVNLRADWKGFVGSSFDFGVFVNNALDKEYLTAYTDVYTSAPIGLISRIPGEPRSFGFDVRYNFGARQ